MHRIEHNVETNEVVEIALTEAEIKQFDALYAANKIESDKKDQEHADKKAQQDAIYQRLGITAEEAKLLLS
jgi:hypothetical protein